MRKINVYEKMLDFLVTYGGVYHAKGDQEKTMKSIGTEQKKQEARQGAYLKSSGTRLGEYGGLQGNAGRGSLDLENQGTGLRGNVSAGREELLDKFRNYPGLTAAGGAATEGGAGGGGGGGGAPGPGGAPEDYTESQEGFRKLMKTGGVDLTDVNDTIKKLKDYAATGGMTAEEKANIMRPHYLEQEKTGGYTPEQLANIKKESNAVIPSMYKNIQDEMNRRRAASGYGPGYGAAQQSVARQGAIGAGEQALKTNVGLAESVRQGKMSAADALQRGQLGISDITSRNTLGGYGSAGQFGLGGQELMQKGLIAGSGGLSDITTQQGRLAAQRAETAAASGRAAAALAESQRQFDLGLGEKQREFGLGGLSDLYKSDIGMSEDEAKRLQTGMGMDAQTQEALLSQQRATAAMPGRNQQMFGNIMQGVGAGAGLMTGLGGLYNKKPGGSIPGWSAGPF
jgi:hypothetical protein